jgi:hypothetical protein
MSIISRRATCALLAVAGFLAIGCAGVSYRPVQEIDFRRFASDGCTRAGDRFSTSAQISSATRETVVLWDGRDGTRTLAVRLPKQGIGSRMGAIVGKSRYDLGFTTLNELRETGTPITMTMRCERANMAPAADRYSYLDRNGRRVEFEF